MTPRASFEALTVTAGALVLAVVMTWPMAPRLGQVGRVNTGDGQLSIWNVAWVARTLFADPVTLFDANIFYPHRNTLAYSESNIGAGLMAAPVWWATKNPFAAHNSAVLAAFALSAICAYALGRVLTADRVAAAVLAVAFACCPFVYARFAHIQLLMIFGIPLSLAAFHWFVDRPGLARASLLGVSLAVAALWCSYYGVFAGLTVGLGAVYYASTRHRWRDPRYWSLFVFAAGLSAAIVVPFFLPYLDVREESGFRRTLQDSLQFSASWRDYLVSDAWVHRWMHPFLRSWIEVLFPGYLTTGLGLCGLALALRSAQPDTGDGNAVIAALRPGETAGFYTLLGTIAFWASFGPTAWLYTALYYTIPVFSFLRAPARFGLVVTTALATGAALLVARWRASARTPMRRAALAALVPLFAIELAAVPLYLPQVQPFDPVYRILRALPRAPVVELPFFYNRPDFPQHAQYMLYSTAHWFPLVNGYSDNIPDDFREMVMDVSTFPSRAAFRRLQPRRVRYAIFHLRLYDSPNRERLMDAFAAYSEFLTPLSREGDVWLYEIAKYPILPQ